MIRRLSVVALWLGLPLAWCHDTNALYFEKKSGQSEIQVRYLARIRQATVFVADQKTVFSLRGSGKSEAVVHMSWSGANRQAL